MATKTDKKNAIRQDIIDSAKVYSQNLAGKAFLYADDSGVFLCAYLIRGGGESGDRI